MSSISGSAQLQALLDDALGAGVIGSHSRSLLSGDLGPMVLAGASGASLEDLVTADVTLVTLLVDASSSISGAGLEQVVREGQALLLDALSGSEGAEDVLVATWTFSDKSRALHGYLPVARATRLDAGTYQARGGTALYDAWCEAIAANLAYASTLRAGGAPCRSVVVVVTDGEDVCSRRRVADCASLSRDVLASEQFELAFVGVGAEPDFRRVARRMGLPDDAVLVCDQATPEALRRTFAMVSRSTLRASQGRVRPGQGFFAP